MIGGNKFTTVFIYSFTALSNALRSVGRGGMENWVGAW